MGKGSGNGTTRGDRKRNARRERLRGLLPRDGAVIGIDLAEDKQALAVVDHDVRVLARKTVKVKAFRLGEALDWAVAQAKVKGFAQVAVACEPTGPRWMQVQRLCAERGLPLVCIQPLVSHIAREQQDYTPHKTDESDCVLIGRLATELHCYIPEELDETWAHLRHLGRRRAQLITAATALVQRIQDFLSVAWPVVTEACVHPFDSVTWLAALQVVTSRCGGDPARLAALGPEEFTALVRAAVPAWVLTITNTLVRGLPRSGNSLPPRSAFSLGAGRRGGFRFWSFELSVSFVRFWTEDRDGKEDVHHGRCH